MNHFVGTCQSPNGCHALRSIQRLEDDSPRCHQDCFSETWHLDYIVQPNIQTSPCNKSLRFAVCLVSKHFALCLLSSEAGNLFKDCLNHLGSKTCRELCGSNVSHPVIIAANQTPPIPPSHPTSPFEVLGCFYGIKHVPIGLQGCPSQ